MVAADRCMRLLGVVQEKVHPASDGDVLKERPEWPEKGALEFKNVSLRYRPTTEIVLNELTFKVKPAEKIGVVGRTGAGKSTICLALSRIVEICEGSMIVDGLDLAQLPLEEVRRRITVIPQDPTMFTGALRFNLDPARKVDDATMANLLKLAGLEKVLTGDPAGLDQEIAENGANLSSGERQLICICRAILRKSKVVVLDEATANIDVVTEQKIQELIATEFQDSTMLTVAHRLNTIKDSDRILLLSFGEIVEFDSPKVLTANPDSEFSKLLKDLEKKEAGK